MYRILVHVARKIRGIVRVDGCPHAQLQHAPNLQSLEAAADAVVGDRADRQGQAPAHDLVAERLVLERVDAVVDSVDPDVIEGLPDVPGRILLIHIAVHGQPVALGACPGKHLLELDRRIALLVGVQAYADDPILVRQGLFQRCHCGLGAHVSQETHDELGADTELVLRVHLRPANSANSGVVGDAARGMRLGVEEYLGVEHVLGMGFGQVGGREIVEVLLSLQDAHALVVDLEERRQIVEVVAGPHRLDRLVRKLDVVTPGEIELQLRLERPLHMDVQLGLRHALDEAPHVRHDFNPMVRRRMLTPRMRAISTGCHTVRRPTSAPTDKRSHQRPAAIATGRQPTMLGDGVS